MEYREFTVAVRERVSKSITELEEVKLEVFHKNNGKDKIGLIIKEKTINAAPCIYLESYYRRWNSGEPMNQLVQEIFELYRDFKCTKNWDIERIKDYSAIKNQIAFKLVNYEKNSRRILEIPHVKYCDLAVVFYLLFENEDQEIGSVMIKEELLNFWGISVEELYEHALENTPNLLPRFMQGMDELFKLELDGNQVARREWELYILSNERMHLGAATILYPKVLEEIGDELDDDFYILPSSIHEVLILKAKSQIKRDELDEMIEVINTTQVLGEEVLSNHAYYYSRKSKSILY